MTWKHFLLTEVCDVNQAIGMAILHDIIIAALNSLRHQEKFLEGDAAQREMHARLKELVKKDPRITLLGYVFWEDIYGRRPILLGWVLFFDAG